jgi:voltage-gated potassium channel
MTARRKLVTSLFVVVTVFWVGVFGYMILEKASLGEAIYLTANILSTVGLREPEWVHEPARAWTIVIMTIGIGAVLTAFASLQAMVIGGEVRRVFGRRKLQNRINQLRGHIVICGHGRMGSLVATELHQKNIPIVVVDNDAQQTAGLDDAGVLYVLGPAEEEETLLQAGILHARGIVTCLKEDAHNVFVTLTARSLRSDLVIVARAEQPASQSKLLRAGANRVICPQVIGATRITGVLTRPNVVDFVEVTARGVELEMDEHTIAADSPLHGKRLRDSGLRQAVDAMVVAIRRGDGTTIYNPSPDVELLEKDTLILIGRAGASTRLKNFH